MREKQAETQIAEGGSDRRSSTLFCQKKRKKEKLCKIYLPVHGDGYHAIRRDFTHSFISVGIDRAIEGVSGSFSLFFPPFCFFWTVLDGSCLRTEQSESLRRRRGSRGSILLHSATYITLHVAERSCRSVNSYTQHQHER